MAFFYERYLCLHQALLAPSVACTKRCLHQAVLAPSFAYTKLRLHQAVFTPSFACTKLCLHQAKKPPWKVAFLSNQFINYFFTLNFKGFFGTSPSPVSTAANLSMMSMPSITSPNTVYWLSKKGVPPFVLYSVL